MLKAAEFCDRLRLWNSTFAPGVLDMLGEIRYQQGQLTKALAFCKQVSSIAFMITCKVNGEIHKLLVLQACDMRSRVGSSTTQESAIGLTLMGEVKLRQGNQKEASIDLAAAHAILEHTGAMQSRAGRRLLQVLAPTPGPPRL